MSNTPRWQARELAPGKVPNEVWEQFAQQQLQDQEYIRQFGHARAPVTNVFKGYRFVAVGGQMMWMPAEKGKYFTDFLLVLVQNIFGREWWEAEFAKPRDQRHPVAQWRYKAMVYQNKQPKTDEGIYVAKLTGPMAAYYTFAYDLFVVADNGRLDETLLARLKHPELFQGARHELFAEATCIRAGFTIEHEDESDRSSRHAEFTATHRATGEKVSVEAKSKHRPGVMGRAGGREAIGEHDLPIGKLLNNAIAKNSPHPLVVFMDMNLPWESGARILRMNPPHPLIQATLNKLRVGESKLDPISLLVVSNNPAHYTEDEEEVRTPQLMSVLAPPAEGYESSRGADCNCLCRASVHAVPEVLSEAVAEQQEGQRKESTISH